MKCISLWQPWASLVAIGAKTIETRGWGTSYRGRLAIASTKNTPAKEIWDCTLEPEFYDALDAPTTDILCNKLSGLPAGSVLCICNLVDCVEIQQQSCVGNVVTLPLPKWNYRLTERERAFGNYAPGRFAWILEDVWQLPCPVPAKGKQGFWNWEPPEQYSHIPMLEASNGR